MNKIFPIRKCQNLSKDKCLYFHIGQCLAPCVNKISPEVFDKMREDIKSFMNGNNEKIKSEIKDKMIKASNNMEYEIANEYKQIIDAIDHINTSQNVETKDKKDRDIFAFSSKEGYISLAILIYRKGLLLGKQTFTIEEFGELEPDETQEEYMARCNPEYDQFIANEVEVEIREKGYGTYITDILKILLILHNSNYLL